MSVWKVFGGVKYCAGVCEHHLKRYRRIRDNRDKLIELGLTTPDKPLDCYQTKEWIEHTAAYDSYESLLKQFNDGLILFEEEVEEDPEIRTEEAASSDKDSPVVNRKFKKKKKKSPKKKKKNKRNKKSGKSKKNKQSAGVKRIKIEESDCAECVDIKKHSRPVVEGDIEPEVGELEMFLQSEPDSIQALQDLLVNKDLTCHLREGPAVDIYRLIVDNPQFTHQIIEKNIDSLLPDRLFLKMLRKEYPGGMKEFLEKNEGKTPEEVMGDLPADLLADITDMLEDEEEEEFEDEEEEYKFSRVVEDVNDELLNELLDVYDKYNEMPYQVYSEKVKDIIRRLCTLEVIDDEINNKEETNNSETTPKKDVTSTPESAFKSPDSSETLQHDSLVDVFRTPCSSASTYHVTEAEDATHNVETTTTTSVTSRAHPSSDTATEKLPTILSNRQAYENIDKIPVPSWFADKDEKREDTGNQEEEMDDFDFLGTLDDSYLLSLFSEEEEEKKRQPACVEVSGFQEIPHDVSDKTDSVEDNIATTLPTAESNLHRRTNPPRQAKKGVSYCEDNNQLEDILQSEYFCWQCNCSVIGECESHGPLIAYSDDNLPATSSSNKVPVPSYIEVKQSTIPGAGLGAFTTRFIEPGRILGDYQGKLLSEKVYKKMETAGKETGYAWKAVSKEGDIMYLDGGRPRHSNWLRYLNCARGRSEENVLVRNIPGSIQYYTFKPIKIGEELLVFYGEDYFQELGFCIDSDEDNGTLYHCTVCTRLFKTEAELNTHQCRRTRGVSGKEKVHKCKTCEKMFAMRSDLYKHIRRVHEKIARLSCPYCRYRTDYPGHLSKHKATHTGDKMYKCTQCDYTAIEKKTLTTHIYSNHTNKTYKCRYQQCDVKKPSQEELYEHIRTEHPVQRYVCDSCPMSFKLSQHLTSHKISHSVGQYGCKYCDKLFKTAANLDRHSVTHTGERRHVCTVCNKAFTQSQHLTRHMRTHTGEKPYSCSYCVEKFNVSSSKTRHEITCKSRV